MFVFDTETRTDTTQRLTFGTYRYYVDGLCVEEALFAADDLAQAERAALEAYIDSHVASTDPSIGSAKLRLLTRAEFLEKLYDAAFDRRALLVGFNLPFDLSRIAASVSEARGRYKGGFSFVTWEYVDKNGVRKENRYRPRIVVKHINSKRALKGFSSTKDPDREDTIPEGSRDGKPVGGHSFRGHFLDLRTLAFALTDRGHSLESACRSFGVEHGKMHAEKHGVFDEAYIDYSRRDTEATAELAQKLFEEFDRHPIALQETKAYSPASIGKAYLHAMGIEPILRRQPTFPKKYLGYAQSAFIGGRASAHIRRQPVPCVFVDFLSMYPTVNSLMGLWDFVIAERIGVAKVPVHGVNEFLAGLTLDRCFNPDTWKHFATFVRVIPDGDILPTRGAYNKETHDWQVAINYLYAGSEDPKDGLWFALPDVIASVLLTGKVPKIVEAFQLEAHGQIPGLKPTRLRGDIDVDPRKSDFFRSVIEERKRYARRVGVDEEDAGRTDQFLKVLANATSYGIYAQMDSQESEEQVAVTCYGIDPTPYQCVVARPEAPGEYCFPPMAALITSAARLMLAMLERCIADLGGTYAMEDTDSMAIVATKRGGMVPCPGGPYKTRGREEAIKALSWAQLHAIVDRFAQLNPYDKDSIPGSILKVEAENFDPETKKQRQLWCLAISAKRYALFVRDRAGEPTVLRKGLNAEKDRRSEHGLGHLLNPTDPDSEDRGWISQAWLKLIRQSLGLETGPLPFAKRVAVGRTTVSGPAILRPLQGVNLLKPYAEQIKPFNFVLTAQVGPFGHPIGADPGRFQLIAPYEHDPREWPKLGWIDKYSGKRYTVATVGAHGRRGIARVKSYGDVLREYEFHAESKCADASGAMSVKQTVGLLARRHVRIALLRYIGKESNALEEVEEGVVLERGSPYTEYPDERRDEWATIILPKLKAMPVRALLQSGLSRAAIQAIRAGRRPHLQNMRLLISILAASRASSEQTT